MRGDVPTPPGSSSKLKTDFKNYYDEVSDPTEKQEDTYLCSDCLDMEKHVSNVYNTNIFEFKDQKVRENLNCIQTEEQEHGESISNYMWANGMC